MQAPDGRLVRFRLEFLPFYDRTFHEVQRRKVWLAARIKEDYMIISVYRGVTIMNYGVTGPLNLYLLAIIG